MSKQHGFTLIELIIVIVLLGILSVVAAPRFLDISTDARISALQGMQGTLGSAATLVFAKSVIESNTQGAGSIEASGATISTHSGYPQATLNGFGQAANLDIVFSSGVCEADWCGLGNQTSIPSGISTTGDGRIGKLFLRGNRFSDECGVYYINHRDGSQPEIGIETADC